VLKPGLSAAEGHRVLRDIIGLQVAEQGRDARVVTVSGEIDTLTAPRLASVLTEQLSAARVVVVDLDSVEFLRSAGLPVLFEANELTTEKTASCGWCATPEWSTGWRRPILGISSLLSTPPEATST
jgi:anti-anti-sigma factor